MRIIGKGTFGTVAKAYCNRTRKIVAIKRISDFDAWEYLMVQVIREVSLMKELSARPDGCKYVPIIYDVLVHEEPEERNGEPKGKLSVFIVMEHFETDMK